MWAFELQRHRCQISLQGFVPAVPQFTSRSENCLRVGSDCGLDVEDGDTDPMDSASWTSSPNQTSRRGMAPSCVFFGMLVFELTTKKTNWFEEGRIHPQDLEPDNQVKGYSRKKKRSTTTWRSLVTSCGQLKNYGSWQTVSATCHSMRCFAHTCMSSIFTFSLEPRLLATKGGCAIGLLLRP